MASEQRWLHLRLSCCPRSPYALTGLAAMFLRHLRPFLLRRTAALIRVCAGSGAELLRRLPGRNLEGCATQHTGLRLLWLALRHAAALSRAEHGLSEDARHELTADQTVPLRLLRRRVAIVLPAADAGRER